MSQDRPEGAPARPLPPHERFHEATSTLHAALRAALHLTGHHDLLRAADSFADAVIRHSGGSPADEVGDEALMGVLRDYAEDLEAQAQRLARDSIEMPAAQTLRLGVLGPVATPHPPGTGGANPRALAPDAWERLRRPFRFDEVELVDIRVDAGARRGTATPVATTDALLARLDEVVGPGGWSVRFDPAGGSHTATAKATVAIAGFDGAIRDGFGHGPSLQAACGAALRTALRLFGIGRGLHGEATLAVDVDDAGAILNAESLRDAMEAAGVVAPERDTATHDEFGPGESST